MKRICLAAVLALSCTEKTPSPPAAGSAAMPAGEEKPEGPLPLGTLLPEADVELRDAEGQTFTIGKIAGEKGTLVVFTCNHCPYVKGWEGRITELGNEFAERGIGVIAINPNDPQKQPEDGIEGMKERAKKLGLEFPYVVDETSGVARTYGATKTPEVYLFDADKKLVYHGAVDDEARDPAKVSSHWLRDALEAVVGGRPVPVAETKAVGCGIKFRAS